MPSTEPKFKRRSVRKQFRDVAKTDTGQPVEIPVTAVPKAPEDSSLFRAASRCQQTFCPVKGGKMLAVDFTSAAVKAILDKAGAGTPVRFVLPRSSRLGMQNVSEGRINVELRRGRDRKFYVRDFTLD